MRKLLLVAGLLLAFPLVSLAQDAPKAEIFGGYSYLNPKDGDDLHGWNASVTGNINKWFGLKADFSGYYDTEKTAFAKFSQSNHLFLAGGQFTYRKNDRVQPFAHLMAGTAYSRFKSRVNCPLTPTTVACTPFNSTISDTHFALVAGGGVDLKVANALAVRLIQADYLYVRDDGFNVHSLRLSTGLVVRLGEQ